MIERPDYLNRLDKALSRNPIAMLAGPRQVGKSTLAQLFSAGREVTRFDLEHPTSLLLLEQPLTALEHLRGLVVIDEAHARPNSFPCFACWPTGRVYPRASCCSPARHPSFPAIQ